MTEIQGAHISIRGIVQGVGFRPFVYNLATQMSMKGWVRNTSAGVGLPGDGGPGLTPSFIVALYSTRSSYASQLAQLINDARTEAGLPALSINATLQAAAQAHSIDMACHNLLSHTGSDGSSPGERIAAAGYAASSSSEIIYGSGYPETAFDWWMNDAIHRDEILNPYVTEMGVGYAYNNQTAYGSYFTVDFASP